MPDRKKGASPAAAAGVSRVLKAAGLHRAIEISKGLETEGYYTSPVGDHVRVEYVPSPFEDDPSKQKARIRRGIAACKVALIEKFDVTEARALLAYPGEMREAPVLEVRSPRWET
jgi:hypothetical protein